MDSDRNSNLTRMPANDLFINHQGEIKIAQLDPNRNPKVRQYQFLFIIYVRSIESIPIQLSRRPLARS
jgi:hypothetical protein